MQIRTVQIRTWWRLILLLIVAAACAAPALAQQPSASDQTAPGTTNPPPKKKPAKPKPPAPNTAADPATAAPAAGAKPPKPKPPGAGGGGGDPAAAIAGGAKPTLLGQFGDWGAYAASPGGKKVCFAIAKPATSETAPPAKSRNPTYMFISSRPSDRVSNEVSIIIGYPFKPSTEASVDIGGTSFPLYTQQDGAWIKNAADEPHLIEVMRAGQNAVVKGVSAKGTRSTDVFSLKGLSQALDRSGQDCQ
jgi:Invasion associated locus B (IalB) protein